MRNVRSLVDKLKKDQKNQDELQRDGIRVFVALGIVVMVLLVFVLAVMILSGPTARVELPEAQSSETVR